MAGKQQRPPALQPVNQPVFSGAELLTPLSSGWLTENHNQLSLDDIPASSQLPLSASILLTPKFLWSYTAPGDADTQAIGQLKEEASELGQQAQALLTGLYQTRGENGPATPIGAAPNQQNPISISQPSAFNFSQKTTVTVNQSQALPSQSWAPPVQLQNADNYFNRALNNMPGLFGNQSFNMPLAAPAPVSQAMNPSTTMATPLLAAPPRPVAATSQAKPAPLKHNRHDDNHADDSRSDSPSSTGHASSVTHGINLEIMTEELLAMTGEELRDELRKRQLSTLGQKPALVDRLKAHIIANPSIPIPPQLSGDHHKHKKSNMKHKREPVRGDFDTQKEFEEAWEQWRKVRDSNNNSVKKSRAQSKDKKLEHERMCQERERENATLEKLVKQLREEVSLLTRMLRQPETLNDTEQSLLQSLIQNDPSFQ